MHLWKGKIRNDKNSKILEIGLEEYLEKNKTIGYKQKVINAIKNCKSDKLGAHKYVCDECGYEEIAYNSCRNRHCPNCQTGKKLKWIEARKEEVLNIKYYVVDQAKSNYHSVVINEKFRQFAKDANFNIITCRPYRPQTKGKVENLAKIMDRLKAYNNEFDSIYDLYAIIEDLNIELNNEIVQGLGQTPNERFEKEKSTLTSVNLDLLEPYYIPTKEYKVSNESMITYKSKKYSVPPYLIGKNVTVKESDSGIYIYYSTNFVCSYNTNESLRLNYKDSHYKDILRQDAFKDATDDELEAQILRNLEFMDSINIERDDEIWVIIQMY